jgi:hypothetical protein
MSKHEHHKVKTHHWNNGVLKAITHFFANVEEAMAFAKSSTANSVKVYDTEGELIHSESPTPVSTYA